MDHRFHIDRPFVVGETLELTGEELHHAAHVVRLRVNEAVELFDGHGGAATASAVEVSKQRAVIRVDSILEISRELPFRLTLAAAIIHPDKFELVLQKATELGVTTLIPLLTDRVETRQERVAGKRERWERIVLEATKQCGRAVIPSLSEPANFAALSDTAGVRLLFDAEAASAPLPIDEARSSGVTLFIGPEGGWSDDELSAARAKGFVFQRLGTRRLRAETAAIAGIVSLSAQLGVL
jgi:16S rRNA (uracil1498-N3)-methyltransferase